MERKELLATCEEIFDAIDERDPTWRERVARLEQTFGHRDLEAWFFGDQTAAYIAARLLFVAQHQARTLDDFDLERLVAMVRYSLGSEAEVDGAEDVLKKALRTPQLDALLRDSELSPRAVVRIAQTGADMAVPLSAGAPLESDESDDL
jgi:hypothetical protein